MTTITIDRAVVEQALDFCEFAWRDVPMNDYAFERLEATITALRSALEQPQQEPVAWLFTNVQSGDIEVSTDPYDKQGEREYWHPAPLYTAPPAPRTEQPRLTDEEIYECERLAAIRHQRHKHSIRGQQITPADDLNWHFARAIEAKLREKNT